MSTSKMRRPSGKHRGKRAASLEVLVVENHPDMRRGLETFFELLDCKAHFVEGVASAVEAAAGKDFDVLLSDINLPDGDGWELVEQLDSSGRRPPIAIAMSGYGSVSDLARSKQVGFMAHLVKPFSADKLKAILQKAPASMDAPVRL